MTITDIVFYIAMICAIVSLVIWGMGEMKNKKERDEKIKEEIRRELFSNGEEDNNAASTDELINNNDNIVNSEERNNEFNGDGDSMSINKRDI